jgi:hypothetical protein
MIKLPIILAATVIAAVPCYAQDVRVFSGDQEHVYGPGGQLVDGPELRTFYGQFSPVAAGDGGGRER